jgi:hypothetical protein
MTRLPGLLRTCRRLGVSGTAKLFEAAVLAPLLTFVWRVAVVGYGHVDSIGQVLVRRTRMRRWLRRQDEVTLLGRERQADRTSRFELARARPGRVGSHYPAVVGVLEGRRGPGEVRRSYAGRPGVFLKELNVLHRLGLAGVSVPEVLDIDFHEPALVTSFVGSWHVTPQLPREAVLALGDEMHRIHRAGFALGGFRPEMVVVDSSGKPWWADFTRASEHPGLPWEGFRFLVDKDVESFNRFFGTTYPTYSGLRTMARSRKLSQHFGSYSPAYLGAGIRTGPIWSLGTGWGRWESLLRRSLPDPTGMRILDLGANNGHNGLEMLRHGAREVVGIELNVERVVQGFRLKQAYEWSDGRLYPYLGCHGDMRDVTRLGLGSFDMVTALCSLYYLEEGEMVQLVSELREMTPILVLECNQRQDIGRADPDTYRKASLDFNLEVLHRGGFRDVEVIAPRWSQRPVLIGRR